MRNLWKSVLGLWVMGMWLGVSAPAQAGSAIGPYYATPSWDQTLPAATRFIVLTNMSSEAVLDRETGLVWEQSPDTSSRTWVFAQDHCNTTSKGGRFGWRLPTIQELTSLLDKTVPFPGPALPSGHPFTTQGFAFWSATVFPGDPSYAYDAGFSFGTVGTDLKTTIFGIKAWCVRGGQGAD